MFRILSTTWCWLFNHTGAALSSVSSQGPNRLSRCSEHRLGMAVCDSTLLAEQDEMLNHQTEWNTDLFFFLKKKKAEHRLHFEQVLRPSQHAVGLRNIANCTRLGKWPYAYMRSEQRRGRKRMSKKPPRDARFDAPEMRLTADPETGVNLHINVSGNVERQRSLLSSAWTSTCRVVASQHQPCLEACRTSCSL
ncbi:hypothetical protein BD289DRAFT_185634 [Coniella lustricola]|uniref:Uncharacterized protein n=1 Tax=Coniella lustricola TaxID=2025994 RepID=A0A2T2ZT28_9PEZI|nr:hypothetical protein BD289DRAFT_185634 [Coniella lustricola]